MEPGKRAGEGRGQEEGSPGHIWPCRNVFILPGPKSFRQSGVGGQASVMVMGWQEGMSPLSTV